MKLLRNRSCELCYINVFERAKNLKSACNRIRSLTIFPTPFVDFSQGFLLSHTFYQHHIMLHTWNVSCACVSGIFILIKTGIAHAICKWVFCVYARNYQNIYFYFLYFLLIQILSQTENTQIVLHIYYFYFYNFVLYPSDTFMIIGFQYPNFVFGEEDLHLFRLEKQCYHSSTFYLCFFGNYISFLYFFYFQIGFSNSFHYKPFDPTLQWHRQHLEYHQIKQKQRHIKVFE